ncbi:hypothetical protein SLEP1_g32421 [Rubroshorea leprosula]|uniref:Uncharacterized protein n=1 Tax=Rubroshorea leprosula TaxID=152421 RepID=A0AAV5KDA2_9ROSI|nr:hypothetical protein SLEP1_g32421 [Rubroshorea leprosula]
MGQIILFFALGSRILRKKDHISLKLVTFWKELLKFITAWVDSSVFQVKSPLETLLGLLGCWVLAFRINF